MKSIKEIFNLRHTKALRIGVLLLSTLLITSASALVYYSIQNQTVATTASAGVKFIAGNDCSGALGTNPCGVSISAAGTYAALTLKTYPNATVTYQFALNVSNTDATVHKIRLNSQAISGGSTNYAAGTSNVKFYIEALNSTLYGPITYTGGVSWATAGNPTTFVVIPNGQKFAIQVVATADSTATIGATTTITVNMDVQ